MQLPDHPATFLKVSPPATFSIDETALVTVHHPLTTSRHGAPRSLPRSTGLRRNPARTLDVVVRCAAAWLLLPVLTSACAHGPGSDAAQDTAEMGVPVTADAGLAVDGGAEGGSVPDPSMSVSPSGCASPEQGCPCDHWGETLGCKGPVLIYGTYVTCAGIRECVNGAWSPCWPLAAPTGSTNGVK